MAPPTRLSDNRERAVTIYRDTSTNVTGIHLQMISLLLQPDFGEKTCPYLFKHVDSLRMRVGPKCNGHFAAPLLRYCFKESDES